MGRACESEVSVGYKVSVSEKPSGHIIKTQHFNSVAFKNISVSALIFFIFSLLLLALGLLLVFLAPWKISLVCNSSTFDVGTSGAMNSPWVWDSVVPFLFQEIPHSSFCSPLRPAFGDLQLHLLALSWLPVSSPYQSLVLVNYDQESYSIWFQFWRICSDSICSLRLDL